MRNTILLVSLIFITSCTEEETTYIYNNEDVIGNIFTNNSTNGSIEFKSENLLIWTISYNRDTSISYQVNYTINGNEIQFEVEDVIESTYTNELTGDEISLRQNYQDTFKGIFINANTIDANVVHSFSKFSDSDLTSSGSSNLQLAYKN
ncbi:MAG: hypothetical protein N4A71_27260 [Carboxylicivirga sp.]|nr:hypothetical protein [Carboxylicivirga sp.]